MIVVITLGNWNRKDRMKKAKSAPNHCHLRTERCQFHKEMTISGWQDEDDRVQDDRMKMTGWRWQDEDDKMKMTRWRWQDEEDRMKMTGCRLASGQQCPLSVIGCQVQIRNGNNKCDWDWKLKLTVVLYLFFYISNQQKEVGIGSLLVSSNLFESQRKAFLFKDFSFLLWNYDWNVRITTSTLRGR